MGRTYAGILGPLAFTTVITRTLIDGGGGAALPMATICLFAFAAIGYLAGQIAERIIWDTVRTRLNDEIKAREAAGRKPGTEKA